MTRPLRALLVLFFVSGATSLVYQTVWARELHLLLGTSSFAVSTVLAAFMAGLGVGGAVAARHADRVARPLWVYGWLELFVGAYALGFPFLVDGVATPVVLGLHRVVTAGPLVSGVLQAGIVGVLLLPPTAAMGATLPLLARLVTDRLKTAGDRVGLLYAVNTAGAVAGTGLAGLLLLPWLGLWTTTAIAAGGNAVLGVVALVLSPRLARVTVADDLDRDLIDGAVKPEVVALWVIGLGGAASLACEVVWTRLVGLVLGGTTYAFTAMLLAVLCGVALGGRLGGPLADRSLRRGGTLGVLTVLAGVEVAIAATCWGLTFLWPELPYWFVWLYDALRGSAWVGAPFGAAMLICIFVLLPPAVLMGAAFPLAVRAAAGDTAAMGGPVGGVYAANTLGGVLGSALAGFVALPWLGLRGTVAVAVLLNLVAATVALARCRRPVWALGVLACGAVPFVAQAPWDPVWMSGGMYQYVSRFDNHSREGIHWFATGNQEALYYREGLSSVVLVARNNNTGNLWLANNGKVDASTAGDLPTQVLCALLASQYVDDPEHALVIGLASGITAGATSLMPGVERLEVVELEPAIFEAAAYFDAYNWGVLRDPRLELVANDGRNHVLRAEPGTWDSVVSEPPNPYLSGVANLFTREFWQLGRTRLAPGGVWSQWVQVYGMTEDDLKALLRTFADVFPHVAVYAVNAEADLVLMGAEHPLVPHLALAEEMRGNPEMAGALDIAGAEDAMDLVAMYAMDRDALLDYAGEGPWVDDDNMRIEFSAPLTLHRSTMAENWAAVLAHARVPFEAVPEAAYVDLGRAYAEAGDERRADLVLSVTATR